MRLLDLVVPLRSDRLRLVIVYCGRVRPFHFEAFLQGLDEMVLHPAQHARIASIAEEHVVFV
jgi:hypothetical protein